MQTSQNISKHLKRLIGPLLLFIFFCLFLYTCRRVDVPENLSLTKKNRTNIIHQNLKSLAAAFKTIETPDLAQGIYQLSKTGYDLYYFTKIDTLNGYMVEKHNFYLIDSLNQALKSIDSRFSAQANPFEYIMNNSYINNDSIQPYIVFPYLDKFEQTVVKELKWAFNLGEDSYPLSTAEIFNGSIYEGIVSKVLAQGTPTGIISSGILDRCLINGDNCDEYLQLCAINPMNFYGCPTYVYDSDVIYTEESRAGRDFELYIEQKDEFLDLKDTNNYRYTYIRKKFNNKEYRNRFSTLESISTVPAYEVKNNYPQNSLVKERILLTKKPIFCPFISPSVKYKKVNLCYEDNFLFSDNETEAKLYNDLPMIGIGTGLYKLEKINLPPLYFYFSSAFQPFLWSNGPDAAFNFDGYIEDFNTNCPSTINNKPVFGRYLLDINDCDFCKNNVFGLKSTSFISIDPNKILSFWNKKSIYIGFHPGQLPALYTLERDNILEFTPNQNTLPTFSISPSSAEVGTLVSTIYGGQNQFETFKVLNGFKTYPYGSNFRVEVLALFEGGIKINFEKTISTKKIGSVNDIKSIAVMPTGNILNYTINIYLLS